MARSASNMVAQDTFDHAVKETMEDFEMEFEEARSTPTKMLPLQLALDKGTTKTT